MSDLAASDVTVTVNEVITAGRKHRNDVKIVFGDGALTYPSGGVPMPTFGSFGMIRNIEKLALYDSNDASGIIWKYDKDNHKLRGYEVGGVAGQTFTGTAKKPLLVTEEVVAVSSHTGTLTHVPFYVVAIEVTAGSVTGAFNIIPTGETAATKECAVTLTDGVLTFFATDAVTSCRVTYIPLQLTGPFVEANRVIDESVTAAAAKATLANQACAIQYVYDDTDSALVTFEPVGEAPSATHTCVVDIDAGSSDTNIDSHADDEANSLKVTYIKYSALNAAQCIGDGDLSLTSEAYDFTGTANYRALVIPGLGTQFCGEEAGAGNELGTWEGPNGTAANTVGVWNPYKNYILTNNTNAIVTLAMPFFVLDEAEIQPETPAGTLGASSDASAMELDAGSDAPAAQTLYAEAVGW
jgi:hypothetical protein